MNCPPSFAWSSPLCLVKVLRHQVSQPLLSFDGVLCTVTFQFIINYRCTFHLLGQKYAVMEEKVVLATVLRNFHLESLEKREDLVLIGELVLRPRDGVQVRLTPKQITPSSPSC
jgi:hypothetical protein